MNDRAQIKQHVLDKLASGYQFIDHLQPVENLHHRFLLDVLRDILNKVETIVPFLLDNLDDHQIAQYRYVDAPTVVSYMYPGMARGNISMIDPASWLLVNSQGVFIYHQGMVEQLYLLKFNEFGNISERTVLEANRDPAAQTQLKLIAEQRRRNGCFTFLANPEEQTLINRILLDDQQQFEQKEFFVILYLIVKIQADLSRRANNLEDSSSRLYLWMTKALFVIFLSVIFTKFALIGVIGAYLCILPPGLFPETHYIGNYLSQFVGWSIFVGLIAAIVTLGSTSATTIVPQLYVAYLMLTMLTFLISVIMIGIEGYRTFLYQQHDNALNSLTEPLEQTRTYTSATSFLPDAYQSFNKREEGMGFSAVTFPHDKEVNFRIHYNGMYAFFKDHQQELIQLHSDSENEFVLK